jgi:hypothetical protein
MARYVWIGFNMATKPTKQQVAQGKARAGGNNPVKVTKADVKRLGKAALIAGSMLPAGRGIKAVQAARKMTRTNAAIAKHIAENNRITTNKIASNSVKVKFKKQAMENSIKDNQLKTKRPDMSASRPVVSRPGSSRAVKINSQRNLKAK